MSVFMFILSLLSLPICVHPIIDNAPKASPISIAGDSPRLNDNSWHSVYFMGRDHALSVGVDDDIRRQATGITVYHCFIYPR